MLNPTDKVIDKVLTLIANKYEAQSVFIECGDTHHHIFIKNKYGNLQIYCQYKTREELNIFISGYFACWSDDQ